MSKKTKVLPYAKRPIDRRFVETAPGRYRDVRLAVANAQKEAKRKERLKLKGKIVIESAEGTPIPCDISTPPTEI
jgi:hypothetical protein